MHITKRDGRREAFDITKIENAIRKSLDSTGKEYPGSLPASLAETVASSLSRDKEWSVEEIQDAAEKTLMAAGEFEAAKNYILFRSRRTELRKERQRILEHYPDSSIESVLSGIQKDYPDEKYSLSVLAEKYISFSRSGMGEEEEENALVRAAVELTSPQTPLWEFIAARFLLFSFRTKLSSVLSAKGIRGFYDKVRFLTDAGLYGEYILENYIVVMRECLSHPIH